MARPQKPRWVEIEPGVTYYKPRAVPLAKLKEETLTVDEFEALRLADHLGLNQTQGAARMRLHQSTFQRLLAKARHRLASAIVNGRAIRIQGGVYKMPFRDGTGPAGGPGRTGRGYGGPGSCVCPKCGTAATHQRGIPCTQMRCPDCGSPMVRGD